ncbi:MAG: AMP-binding protein [Flavobacteriales bacterium]
MVLDFSKNIADIEFTSYHNTWEKEIILFVKEYLQNSEIKATTSGSTGKPKTICIPKEFMKNSALMTGHYFDLKPGQTALLCLPIHYIAGKMMLVRAIELKLKLICISPSGSPLTHINTPIDFCSMIPLQVEQSLSKLTLIKQLIIGGAPISNQLKKQLQNITTSCFATYGMTETVTHIAIKPLNHKLKSNYYTTLEGISVEKDSRGCLIINCPHLNFNKVITNDMIKLINEKQFQFLGRYDHVINSGGIKIHPEIIEEKLSTLFSERFFITSIPDKKLGEKVVLIIERKNPNPTLDLTLYLEKFEVPKHIFYTKHFIETLTGKIRRKETLNHIMTSHHSLS